MKLLITGASSYVGARIFFDLQKAYSLTGTYFQNQLSQNFIQLNLTDRKDTEKTILEMKPDNIIHVANYPSQRNAVNNEESFAELNKKSTEYIINAANKIGAKVIFISSLAAEHPSDIYGKLKKESEELVKTVTAGYLILRCSLIVGFSPNIQNDRPFNRILKCIKDKTKPAEFDISWKLQPCYIGHISQIIDQTIQNNLWNKTVPVFINEVVTQYQIAKDILTHFNIPVEKVDKHMNIPLAENNHSQLVPYNLEPKSYIEMVSVIIDEIDLRKKFII